MFIKMGLLWNSIVYLDISFLVIYRCASCQMAAKFFIVCMYYILFEHSIIEEYLGFPIYFLLFSAMLLWESLNIYMSACSTTGQAPRSEITSLWSMHLKHYLISPNYSSKGSDKSPSLQWFMSAHFPISLSALVVIKHFSFSNLMGKHGFCAIFNCISVTASDTEHLLTHHMFIG